MGMPNSSYGRTPAARYGAAANRYADDAQWVDRNRTQASTRRSTAGTTADNAYGDVNDFDPTETRAFRPNELTGFDPSSYLSAAAAGGYSGRQGAGSRTANYQGGALAGYGSNELKNFSSADVSDFDPSAFGKEYAQGAYGEFQNNLGDELDTLSNQAAAGGRLNTGYFDKDRGGVVTRLGSDFSNKLAQAATVFSGQRLDALSSGADMRLRRAQGIDQNMLDAARGSDELGLEAARAADASDFDYAQLEETAAGRRQGAAGDAARLAYDRAARIDEMNYGRGHDIDSMRFDARRTGLSAALDRERLASGENESAMDRSAEYSSSARDWAAADRDYQDSRSDRADEVRRRDRADSLNERDRNSSLEPIIDRHTGAVTGYRRRYIGGGASY